jgi:hypothetical protein
VDHIIVAHFGMTHRAKVTRWKSEIKCRKRKKKTRVEIIVLNVLPRSEVLIKG